MDKRVDSESVRFLAVVALWFDLAQVTWESQVLLTDCWSFPKGLQFSPTFDERSA